MGVGHSVYNDIMEDRSNVAQHSLSYRIASLLQTLLGVWIRYIFGVLESPLVVQREEKKHIGLVWWQWIA